MDNRKVQNLPSDLFKLYINLLCYANQASPRGHLGRIADITFRLRTELNPTIEQLADLRRRRLLDGGWRNYQIHNWAEWQPDSDANLTPGRRGRNAERTQKERATPVVRTPREEEDKDKKREDKDVEKDQDARPFEVVPLVVSLTREFERSLGRMLSPMELESIKHLETEHPRERIDYALREAADLGKRSVRYIQRICENQALNGDNHDAGKRLAQNGSGTQGLTTADRATLDAWGVTKPREFYLD